MYNYVQSIPTMSTMSTIPITIHESVPPPFTHLDEVFRIFRNFRDFGVSLLLQNMRFLIGILIIPVFWVSFGVPDREKVRYKRFYHPFAPLQTQDFSKFSSESFCNFQNFVQNFDIYSFTRFIEFCTDFDKIFS